MGKGEKSAVNLVRVVALILNLLTQGYRIAGLLYISVEARSISGMAATGALLANLQDESVLIAVGQDFLHDLGVAGRGALVPDLLAAAGKVDRFPDFESFGERFLVHVGDHEDLVAIGILRDRHDETVIVKFRGKGESALDEFAIVTGAKGDFC